jgi:hypothetical protein
MLESHIRNSEQVVSSHFRAKVSQKSFVRPGQRSSVQRDDANRARSTLVRERNVAALRAFLHSHRRDNRNTKSCAHHTQDAAELAALKNNFRVETGSLTGRDRSFAEAMAVTQQEKRGILQLLERDRSALCQSMLFWQNRIQFFYHQGKRLIIVTPGLKRQRHNRYVHRSCSKSFEQQRCNFFRNRDVRLWVFPGKRGQDRRQEIRGNRRDHPNGNQAADRHLSLDDIASRGFQVTEYRPRTGEKRSPQLRKLNRTAEAIKEPGPQFIFQLSDLLRKRGL